MAEGEADGGGFLPSIRGLPAGGGAVGTAAAAVPGGSSGEPAAPGWAMPALKLAEGAERVCLPRHLLQPVHTSCLMLLLLLQDLDIRALVSP